jgi:hypothetical protein
MPPFAGSNPAAPATADIVLLRGHHPPEAEIARRGLAVELVAGDMALLDAHHAERLGAVGRDADAAAGLPSAPAQRIAIARRHRELIGELAGERDPEQPRRNAAADVNSARREIGEGLVGDIVLGSSTPAAPRATSARRSQLRPLLGDRDHAARRARATAPDGRIRDAASPCRHSRWWWSSRNDRRRAARWCRHP